MPVYSRGIIWLLLVVLECTDDEGGGKAGTGDGAADPIAVVVVSVAGELVVSELFCDAT